MSQSVNLHGSEVDTLWQSGNFPKSSKLPYHKDKQLFSRVAIICFEEWGPVKDVSAASFFTEGDEDLINSGWWMREIL